MQALETLCLSAITVAELRFGVQSLFAGRVLAFDPPASQACAELMAKARSEGRTIPVSDGYIAATAAANGMMVATRDTAPFEAAGLKTVNPWAVQETTGARAGLHRSVFVDHASCTASHICAP